MTLWKKQTGRGFDSRQLHKTIKNEKVIFKMNFNKLSRYLYTSVKDSSYESIMENIRIYLGMMFIAIIVFNGFVWTKIFDNYKSFHQETLV